DTSIKGDFKIGPVTIGAGTSQRGSQTRICVPDQPNPPFQAPPPDQLSNTALENAVRQADQEMEDALIRLGRALDALDKCYQNLAEQLAKDGVTSRRERTLACGYTEGDPLP